MARQLELQQQELRSHHAAASEIAALAERQRAFNDHAAEAAKRLAAYRDGLDSVKAAADGASVTITTGIQPATQKLLDAFDQARQKGEDVAQALNQITKDFDPTRFDSVKTVVSALAALELSGKASAKQLRDELLPQIAKLSGPELRAFEENTQRAFGNNKLLVNEFRLALSVLHERDMKLLGVDAESAGQKLTKAL